MSTPQEQAKAHADLLLSTGMAYEITPHTIAYRAFLDGFTAGSTSHPDTKRLDWLEEAPSERLADVRRIIWQQRDTCMVTRAAIDSAMKEHP